MTSALELSLLAALALVGLGLGAGVLGALVGVGGGIVIVPALVVAFGIDVRIAVAASLLSVVATSVAAGSVHLGSGLANLRLGLRLEVVTTAGAIAGGLVATSIPTEVLSFLLAGVLLLTVALLLRRGRDGAPAAVAAAELRRPSPLAGSYTDGYSGQIVVYDVERLPAGAAVSGVSGAISGMLGVGGGFLKTPAMNLLMGVPLKVAAATSNFTVGITALASLSVYVTRGLFHPYLAALLATGVALGALWGARLQHRSSPRRLKQVLAAVLVFAAVQVIMDATGG